MPTPLVIRMKYGILAPSNFAPFGIGSFEAVDLLFDDLTGPRVDVIAIEGGRVILVLLLDLLKLPARSVVTFAAGGNDGFANQSPFL